MNKNHFSLDKILETTLKDFNVDMTDTNLLNDIISNIIPQTSELILKDLKNRSGEMLEEHRLLQQEFEARLLRRWAKPINLLEMLIVISSEAVELLVNEYRSNALKNNDFLFEALSRIHSRACQISYEILSLLKSGFSDGAFARWRTLYELVIISYFIKQNDNVVALKYLEYECIETYNEVLEYQENYKKLGLDPFTPKEIEEIFNSREILISKYGRDFIKPYGWTIDILPKGKRNFKSIEEETKLDKFRPYYKLACDNVHGGPKGTNFSLGLMGNIKRSDILPIGSSNYGLALPGLNTAISLLQISTCILTVKSSFERLVIIEMMSTLCDEIHTQFEETQMEIEREEVDKYNSLNKS